MKTLMLGLLLLSSFAYADECVKVSESCLEEKTLPKFLRDFFELEREIGTEMYDVNHVDQFKVFTGENIYSSFSYRNSSMESLNALGAFATKASGVYEAPEYDGFDMIRNAKKLNVKQFREFMNDAFMDLKRLDEALAEGAMENCEVDWDAKVTEYKEIKPEAMKALIKYVFNKDVREVVVYETLDNNDSNVQDAQWIIVSDYKVIVMNRFWYL